MAQLTYSKHEVHIEGTVVRDPEGKYNDRGGFQCKFSVKTKDQVYDQAAGKTEYITCFHSLIMFASKEEQERLGDGNTVAEKVYARLFAGCPVGVVYRPDSMIVESEKDGKIYKNVKPRIYESGGYADASYGGVIESITILGNKDDEAAPRPAATQSAGGRLPARGAAPKAAAAPAGVADPAQAEQDWD